MTTESTISLAILVRRFRERKLLTTVELAVRANLSPLTIKKIEQGKRTRLHIPTIRGLADALELGGDELDLLLRAAGRETLVQQMPPIDGDYPLGIPQPDVELDLSDLFPGSLASSSQPDSVYSVARRPRVQTAVAPDNELGFDDIKALRQACRTSVQRTLDKIRKYVPELYVRRKSLISEFGEFERTLKPCLLIQGEAGVGKTNLLCDLAKTRADAAPTLLLRGTTEITGPLGLWKVVADELAGASGRVVEPARIVKVLDAFLRAHDSTLVIFIDGINENSAVVKLRESLACAVEDASGTAIQICFSCRDVDWRLFEDEIGLVRYIPKSDSGSYGVFLGDFTDSELTEAWKTYSKSYKLTGDLSPTLAEICRHPLMLQFLCEGFRGKRIPPDIHRREIFKRYWEEKLGTRQSRATEAALYKLVAVMFTRRANEVLEPSVIRLTGDEHYERLLSEHVILYVRMNQHDEHWVGFTYDAFLEYAIARYLWDEWNWEASEDGQIASGLRELLAAGREYRLQKGVKVNYRFLPGILVYMLLFLADVPQLRHIVREFLLGLAKWDAAHEPETDEPGTESKKGSADAPLAEAQRWRIFFCDFITKINDLDFAEEFIPELERLVRDPRFPVRWAAGSALGLAAQRGSRKAAELLKTLGASADSKDREVAALAVSHMYPNLDAAQQTLEQLADDINWRVRRAAGIALDNLVRQKGDACIPLLRTWSRSARWRLRRVLAQAKYGLLSLRDQTIALDLLALLTDDKEEDVRWRVVSDLVAMTISKSVRPRALRLLQNLADDPVTIVRQQVAIRLPDLYRNVHSIEEDALRNDVCKPILDRLIADDNRGVRWETARALGDFSFTALASQYLEELAGDPCDEVRFAAEYSRALLDPSGKSLKVLQEAATGAAKVSFMRETLARSSRVMKQPEHSVDLNATWKHDRYGDIQEVLQKGTAELDTPEFVASLFEALLEDENGDIRWALASTLAEPSILDAERILELLPRFLQDSFYWVPREALSSLEKLVTNRQLQLPETLVALVCERTSHENAEVRFAALNCADTIHQTGMGHIDDAVFAACAEDDDRHVRALASSLLRRRARPAE